ncbi:unnamed protein product [Rhizoctonia solani]|uniref:Glutamate--cysteine ligase n=1 Tax=Rhizoctonia solani TaxID=456999 RepID=A0A8H3E9N1_9AGAM|nr:unnamed protein product [Rhizoctonia solani]
MSSYLTAKSRKYADYIREHSVTQFVNLWESQKRRKGDPSRWGDEIEYTVASYNVASFDARLSLRQTEILSKIQELERQLCKSEPKKADSVPEFQPMYDHYMLESAPDNSIENLLSVGSFRSIVTNVKSRPFINSP